ncbi:MAG: DUF4296 domain-containing protein [Saprospiraceae bacterium]|nr:DUF4296 domain-containing protein [Saprospiraceae bacterium]
MRLFLTLCTLIWFLLGCKIESSDNLKSLPREKLRGILTDIYIAGSAIELNPATNKDSLKQLYLTEICKVHGISPEQLKEWTEKLNKDLEFNAELQREVLDSINQMSARSLSGPQAGK